jgi:hypothetical protein
MAESGWAQPAPFLAWHYYLPGGMTKCGDDRLAQAPLPADLQQQIRPGMRACRRCVAMLGLEESEGATK